ncbi:MAG: helix-turn-helix domain-containing protein, partial [Eubacteriales bacterium]|nr:helix-turn-helix domain-containing protein [Eubacteriales bacterium]
PLRDPNLSLRAKGLLAMCLSLPDDWVYNISGLTLLCKEGRDAVMTVLKELEANGYLSRQRIRLHLED